MISAQPNQPRVEVSMTEQPELQQANRCQCKCKCGREGRSHLDGYCGRCFVRMDTGDPDHGPKENE